MEESLNISEYVIAVMFLEKLLYSLQAMRNGLVWSGLVWSGLVWLK